MLKQKTIVACVFLGESFFKSFETLFEIIIIILILENYKQISIRGFDGSTPFDEMLSDEK